MVRFNILSLSFEHVEQLTLLLKIQILVFTCTQLNLDVRLGILIRFVQTYLSEVYVGCIFLTTSSVFKLGDPEAISPIQGRPLVLYSAIFLVNFTEIESYFSRCSTICKREWLWISIRTIKPGMS